MLLPRRKKSDRSFPKFALLDASTEEHGKSLGTVISRHSSVATAVLAQIDFESGNPQPCRTRIVRLSKPVMDGESVDPLHHLAPITE
jgi:hypothetical protein